MPLFQTYKTIRHVDEGKSPAMATVRIVFHPLGKPFLCSTADEALDEAIKSFPLLRYQLAVSTVSHHA
jgi:hypothetical protein